MLNNLTLERSIRRYRYIESPIGDLLLAGDEVDLRYLGFTQGPLARSHDPAWVLDDAAFSDVVAELEGYFAGELHEFSTPPSPFGTTFQRKVWQKLQAVPFGETASYGAIAQAVGSPGASRAVGAANHLNPLPIIVPCHRIIGADGSLTGFGGGLDAKRALLAHEAGHRRQTGPQGELFSG